MNLSYIETAIKLTLGLLSLTLVINIYGKGNLAPNSASDQVQNYVLGGIIGGVIYNPAITVLQFFIILLIWFMLVISLKWLKTNNNTIKKYLDGEAVTLIKNGVLDVEACRKAGFSGHDISFKLRSQGVYTISRVKRADLEQNGQLIIVLYGEESPKYPLITDGVIRIPTLESLDKDEAWLLEKLKEQGYEEVGNIFLAEYDKGNINVITY
jgi:hypothetical protein